MSQYEINLLPKKKNKVADKMLHFVLYYFRYIIVITQIVVIGVFFYRFKVDQNIIDQKEAFNQKQQILAVTIPIIEEARAIAFTTEEVKAHLEEQDVFLAKLNYIISSIPQDTTLRTLKITDSTVSITGHAHNVLSIRSLHRKLSIYDIFSSAEIVSLDKDREFGGYSFSININIEAEKAKKK